MQSCGKYKLHLFTRQNWTTRGAMGEVYIFITALWKVLQRNDENIQLNVIIMSFLINQCDFLIRRWAGRYRGIKNEASSRVITVFNTDKNYLPCWEINICPFSPLFL